MEHDNKNDALYLWTYRCVATQANAAGGAVVIDITPGAGNYLQVIHAYVANSGTNTLLVNPTDSANNQGPVLISQGSAAANKASLPCVGSNSGATGAASNSTGLMIHGTDRLTIYQGAAGAQNDTITIYLRAFVRSSTAPSVSKARSTNAGDVTIVETYNTVGIA